MHGITIIETATGARPIRQTSMAVIGLLATAPDSRPDVKARLAIGTAAANTGLTVTSKRPGALGNAISLSIVRPSANNASLSVAVDGTAITVSLATGATGAATTTAAQLATAIGADADANALVGVTAIGGSTGAGLVPELAAAKLAGGENEAFPLNKPVLVTDVDAAAGLAGAGGTLRAALEAIGDQGSPITVVVRVEDGDSNVIGGTDGNSYTGIQALLAAQATLGVRPRILGAPGLDSQAVTAELVVAAKKLRAMVYAAAIGDDVADVLTYRDNFGDRELMLIWPDTDGGWAGDAVARALGLRAMIDEQQGWHKTISNVTIGGVTALTKDVHFDLQDASTPAGLLNDAQVTTLIRNEGFRFWGNRTCAGEDRPEFSFESAVRTSYALQDMILSVLAPFLDQPMTVGLIKDLLESANAAGRNLVRQGRLIGVLFFYDPAKNSSDQLAAGRPTISVKYTPAAPLENPVIELINTTEYYDGFGDQLA
ncbi:MAG: phage tail sheath subtilisin-like domain-containing protein [Sphingobium sp.]